MGTTGWYVFIDTVFQVGAGAYNLIYIAFKRRVKKTHIDEALVVSIGKTKTPHPHSQQ